MAESPARYWVYENWRAQGHKAVVHRSTCAFCNDGAGLSGGTRSDNGRWLGAFEAEEDAKAAATGTGGVVSIHRCV